MVKKVVFVVIIALLGGPMTPASLAQTQQLEHEILIESLKNVTIQSKEEVDRRKALVDLLAAIEKMRGRISWSDLLTSPLLTGILILAGAVPYANHLYWKRQKKFETEKAKTTKMIELYSDSAQLFTQFLQLMLHLQDAIAEEQTFKGTPGISDALVEGATRARREWTRARLDVEPKIARLLREIPLYFGNKAKDATNNLRMSYNSLPREVRIGEQEVRTFQDSISNLVTAMEPELQMRMGGKHEHQSWPA
ncbi:MAG: hypothetical protein KGL31_01745 [candidate division NC10 bacterium]|nr:hypothetical protein [candidate division NC10 bacterium]MDE2320628.1 hypothetical protein [candidate division NC10 bacterium]